jgi:hypothetical protein
VSELGLLAGHFGDFLSQGSGLVAGTKLTDEAGAAASFFGVALFC